MIPRIRIDLKKDVHAFARASTHRFYKTNVKVLEEVFDRSLRTRRGSPGFLELQLQLLGYLLKTDEVRKKHRRYQTMIGRAIRTLASNEVDLERIKYAQRRFEDMEDYVTATRWFAERLRSVGDGIAWRFLDYDRAALRLLAEHAPVSIPEANRGLFIEVEELLRLAEEEGRPVLLNTITNFLRIGDITSYAPDAGDVRLIEVKSSVAKNEHTRRQMNYLNLIQKGLNSGIHTMPNAKLRKVVIDKPLLTYVRSVEQAMREAEQNLVSSRRFGDYLSVAVFAVDKIIEAVPEEKHEQIRRGPLDRLFSIHKKSTDEQHSDVGL